MNVSDIVDGISNKLDKPFNLNFIQLLEGQSLIYNITSLVLGLVVGIIVIGTPIVMIIEVAYINIPVMRSAMSKIKGNGKERHKVVGLMLRDADLALERASTTDTGRSVNYTYLIIKSKSIFLATLIVTLLITGGGTFVDFIRHIVDGIFNSFKVLR